MKKKALISSIMTIALCVSLIAGSTFALFTSESNVDIAVTSGQVKVVATLDETSLTTSSMGVAQDAGKFENGGTAVINGGKIDFTNITPGDKAEFTIDVTNYSNVAVKYRVNWAVEGELLGALEATVTEAGVTKALKTETIDWTEWAVPADPEVGETKELAISIELPVEAGNEYQNKNATVILTVEAVQANGVVENVATVDELKALAEVGGTATLMNDITLTETLDVTEDVKIVLGGNTLTGNIVASEGADLVVENGKIASGDSSVSAIQLNGANATLNDVTIDSARHGVRVEGGTLVIDGGTYKVNAADAGKTQHAINVGGADEKTTVIINGGTFIGPKGTAADSGAAVNVQKNATLVINGGDFSGGKNNTISGSVDAITINGGTFDQDPSKYAKGCEVKLENGVYTVAVYANDDALDDAIAAGTDTIKLGSGSFIIPDSAQGKTLTIIGNGVDTVIATQDDGSYEGCDYSLDGATVTFEGVTITTDSHTYTGYARCKGTYNNCTINGTFTLYDNSEFNDCTFNVSGDVYNIWTWGASVATFNRCTFNSDGKAMLLYGTANTKLTLNGCTFNDKGGLTDLKAAVEIGNDYNKSYELIVNNTVVNGYEINDKGINTGTTLWANKNSMSKEKLNVVVDGVDVY